MVLSEDYLLESQMSELLEAFQGKSKELEKIEKQIGVARSKYVGSKLANNFFSDKEFIKLGDMIGDCFNFKVVDFNLVNEPSPNAFTVPAGFSITANMNNMNFELDKSKHKFKKKQLSLFVRVTTGLWCNPLFTDGEVLAIIIHEVGHNFQHTLNNGLKIYGIAMMALTFCTIISQAASITGLPTAIINLITSDSEVRASVNVQAKNNPFMTGIMNVGGSILGIIRTIFAEALAILNIGTFGTLGGLSTVVGLLLSNPVDVMSSILINPVKKGAENISDNFASELGYAAELTSALTKISLDPDATGSTVESLSRKVPFLDSICVFFSLPTVILSTLLSSHPCTPKRAANIVRDLEAEMKKPGISPKMKKEIQMQINEVKSVVDTYSKMDGVVDPQALRKSIFSLLTNYDKDPKGPITRIFSDKNLIESVEDLEFDAEFIDELAEFIIENEEE